MPKARIASGIHAGEHGGERAEQQPDQHAAETRADGGEHREVERYRRHPGLRHQELGLITDLRHELVRWRQDDRVDQPEGGGDLPDPDDDADREDPPPGLDDEPPEPQRARSRRNAQRGRHPRSHAHT